MKWNVDCGRRRGGSLVFQEASIISQLLTTYVCAVKFQRAENRMKLVLTWLICFVFHAAKVLRGGAETCSLPDSRGFEGHSRPESAGSELESPHPARVTGITFLKVRSPSVTIETPKSANNKHVSTYVPQHQILAVPLSSKLPINLPGTSNSKQYFLGTFLSLFTFRLPRPEPLHTFAYIISKETQKGSRQQ
jgi:hypothetical protein